MRIGLLLPVAVLAAAGTASAAPFVTQSNQSGIQFIGDGTSNTILFDETSRFNVCFDNVSVEGPTGISDGSSNTILFGEDQLSIVVGQVRGGTISPITDGTSNTIILGEISDDFCVFGARIGDPVGSIADGTSNTIIVGESSQFDICFDSVRNSTGTTSITDGTSNTIMLPENDVCFTSVRVAETAQLAAAGEPGLTVLAVAAAFGMWSMLRRRRARPLADGSRA
jgi:hypothetical protein